MKKIFILLMVCLLLSGCVSIPDVKDSGSTAVTSNVIHSVPAENAENTGSFGSFEAKTLDGETVTQDIFSQADLTVVNLWGTFCPPCIKEMPVLGKLHENPDNVQILGIVLDSMDQYGKTDPAQVDYAKEIMDQSGAYYPCLILNEDLIRLGMASYQYVPTTLFVDRNGNVVGSEVVGANTEAGWRDEIDARLEMIGK